MTSVTISNRYDEKLYHSSSSIVYKDLVDLIWTVDVNFETVKVFYSFIYAGFKPEWWQNKNKRKILISSVPFQEYLNNKYNKK